VASDRCFGKPGYFRALSKQGRQIYIEAELATWEYEAKDGPSGASSRKRGLTNFVRARSARKRDTGLSTRKARADSPSRYRIDIVRANILR
jgi:hypothetical protein